MMGLAAVRPWEAGDASTIPPVSPVDGRHLHAGPGRGELRVGDWQSRRQQEVARVSEAPWPPAGPEVSPVDDIPGPSDSRRRPGQQAT
jgi:hypothetical protein